jgi:hypothetical protein
VCAGEHAPIDRLTTRWPITNHFYTNAPLLSLFFCHVRLVVQLQARRPPTSSVRHIAYGQHELDNVRGKSVAHFFVLLQSCRLDNGDIRCAFFVSLNNAQTTMTAFCSER